MAIILRSSKSVPLTFTEMDANFSELNARATTLENAHIKNVNGVTTSSAQDNAITLDSDNITEGSTNKYFTNANSRSAISVTDAGGDGSLAYNSSTGVITYTGPSAAEVRAHISAGSGITLSSGAISIGNDAIKDTMIDFGTGANQVSTADLPEQTNLYYTNARADARIAAANLTDLNDVTYSSPTTNHVLTWTGSQWQPAEAPGAAGGEANRVANVGGFNELFKDKTGVVLNFRTINHGDNLSITQSTDALTINTVSAPEFGNIKIGGDSIENISTNSNITLKPNGTGIVSIDGALTASGAITGTLATAAQTNVTSLGTLTALQVDNININGNTISSTAGTDLNITPLAGQQIVLDSTIVIDAGVVTGATSVTIDEVTISGNNISTNTTNANLVLLTSGTGVVEVDSNIDMNSNKLVNVTDPASAQDAATKNYVDTRGITFARVGGNSTVANLGGTVSFQGTSNEITVGESSGTFTIGLPSSIVIGGSADIDQIKISGNKIESDVSNADLTLDANGTGNINVSANQIQNVADPTANQHAATKAYVDSSVSSLSSDKINEGNSKVEVTDSGTGSIVTNVDGTDRLTTVAATTTTATGHSLVMGAASNSAGGSIKFLEGTDNGTNGVTLQGAASTADVTVLLPAAADTLVGKATTDTLTNKTLTTPVITTPTINAGGDLKNGATSAGFLKFFEDSDNGTNAVTLIGPASTADVTVTLPAAAGTLALENADTTGTAAIATTITVADEGTDTTCFPTFVTAATGNLGAKTDSVLTYNSSNGTLGATTFSGVATSAQYADLAEIYKPDVDYSPGTIVTIGGTQEITVANHNTQYLAGVISTAPAYLMNSAAEGEAVALVGRVPVRVVGAVNKGQAVFAADGGVATADATGPIVGIALESSSNTAEKLIECLLKV
jgi:hypothetical protein